MSDSSPSRSKWQDMTPAQRAFVIAGATVEIVLTTVAVVDLARRPADQVRGPKVLWLLGCAIQPVGPITYLAVGRRPTATS